MVALKVQPGHALELDPWYLENLACPVDKTNLKLESDHLRCENGHHYSVLDGIPIMLPPGSPAREVRAIYRHLPPAQGIDPYVQEVIGATNGIMYIGIIGKLEGYPIPEMRLPFGSGKRLLDLGCNWGRWCIAASRLGYEAVGLEPNPEAALAARRVAAQMGVHSRYVVGDARYLPFRANLFDVTFSYSVLQHFAKEDVKQSLSEVKRVLVPKGRCQIQMANALGLRSFYHQVKRGFRKPRDFEVRYWTPGELENTFREKIGQQVEIMVDGFLSLNPQAKEAKYLPAHYRAVVQLSDRLKNLSTRLPFLLQWADSLYISSIK